MALTETETQRRLVPINGACAELGGVSRSTIYELVNQGHLTLAHIGRRSFVIAESLDSYIESLIPAAAPPDPAPRD